MLKQNNAVKVVDVYGRLGTLLGPKDFDGYDYNKPSDGWKLVLWDDGDRSWIGTPLISAVMKQTP